VNCKIHHNGELEITHPYPQPSTYDWTGGGGGVWVFDGAPEFHNCLFYSNKAFDGGGVFIDWHDDNQINHAKFYNCTLTKNSAVHGAGGAINYQGTNATIKNCILWGDTASYGSVYAELNSSGAYIALVRYSDIQGGWTASGTGNINADPLFKDGLNDNYHVVNASPCRNAGVNELPQDVGDLDWDGITVTVGQVNGEDIPKDLALLARKVSTVDMGAYEWHVGDDGIGGGGQN